MPHQWLQLDFLILILYSFLFPFCFAFHLSLTLWLYNHIFLLNAWLFLKNHLQCLIFLYCYLLYQLFMPSYLLSSYLLYIYPHLFFRKCQYVNLHLPIQDNKSYRCLDNHSTILFILFLGINLLLCSFVSWLFLVLYLVNLFIFFVLCVKITYNYIYTFDYNFASINIKS